LEEAKSKQRVIFFRTPFRRKSDLRPNLLVLLSFIGVVNVNKIL
jgi:hypothetical protein